MKFNRNPGSLPLAALAILIASAAALAQDKRTVTNLADGVYEIEHVGNPFVNGNTTVIVGQRQVLVVDTCFRPAAAEEDIAQIRQWTNKPVSFVVNTHFHNDHNLGNRLYMDAFPNLTIIAQQETKHDMDMFGPSSARRTEEGETRLKKMLETGKTPDGQVLTDDDKKAVKDALVERGPVLDELRKIDFQSATMTFDHELTIDLGGREVKVMYLGKGNTTGDAVIYLPKEKIVMTGDLVVYPLPYVNDGYPVEWAQTLDRLAQLDADTIVPGHGPVMHDKKYIYLVRDLLKSTVEQMDAKLKQTQPAMFQKLDDVKDGVDLSAFRERFAGSDKDLAAEFDQMSANMVKAAFKEASLR